MDLVLETEETHFNRAQVSVYSSDSDQEHETWPNHTLKNDFCDHALTDYRVKLDIPFFNGHLHIEDYLDWEQSVEYFFKIMNVPLDKQVEVRGVQI